MHALPPGSAGVAAEQDSIQRLIVGRGVQVRGVEIIDCEVLVVEGAVEGPADKPVAARRLHIGETGHFRGSAQVEAAEIHGRFEGHLVVREKLVVFPRGQVSGQLRYGLLVVEEGGQLSGDIAALQAPGSPQEPRQGDGQGVGGEPA